MEVAIYGEPGAYVGLSGIDKAFYAMQAGNELTYSKVFEIFNIRQGTAIFFNNYNFNFLLLRVI